MRKFEKCRKKINVKIEKKGKKLVEKIVGDERKGNFYIKKRKYF